MEKMNLYFGPKLERDPFFFHLCLAYSSETKARKYTNVDLVVDPRSQGFWGSSFHSQHISFRKLELKKTIFKNPNILGPHYLTPVCP
jgi:hypothetical protein